LRFATKTETFLNRTTLFSGECIAAVKKCLEGKYGLICHDQSQLVIAPPLDELEAQFFLRGLEHGIFSIDDEGYVQTQLLPRPSGKNQKQKMLQLFWSREGRRFLFREGVCQLSTVAALILKYGWSVDQIKMEPPISEFRDLAYAVDILIKDATGDIAVCGEVKRDSKELQKLIDGFRYCCGIGKHRKDQCPFKKNHAKYEFCSTFKPAYFFATAPGREVCFKLSHMGDVSIQEMYQGLIYQKEGIATVERSASSQEEGIGGAPNGVQGSP
jgi:hypothetical protein